MSDKKDRHIQIESYRPTYGDPTTKVERPTGGPAKPKPIPNIGRPTVGPGSKPTGDKKKDK